MGVFTRIGMATGFLVFSVQAFSQTHPSQCQDLFDQNRQQTSERRFQAHESSTADVARLIQWINSLDLENPSQDLPALQKHITGLSDDDFTTVYTLTNNEKMEFILKSIYENPAEDSFLKLLEDLQFAQSSIETRLQELESKLNEYWQGRVERAFHSLGELRIEIERASAHEAGSESNRVEHIQFYSDKVAKVLAEFDAVLDEVRMSKVDLKRPSIH